jgi:predicted RNA-binding protein with PIN domain
MNTYLFIDGYNIIGAWPELVELREENLEEARRCLIEIISEYAVASGYCTTVIFDGWKVKGNRGSVVDNPFIDIIFTPEGMTADMVIERLVARLPKYQKIYVATSDRLEQETILAQGGLRISAMELHRMVFAQKDDSRRRMAETRKSRNTLDGHLNDEVRRRLEEMILESREKSKENRKNR